MLLYFTDLKMDFCFTFIISEVRMHLQSMRCQSLISSGFLFGFPCLLVVYKIMVHLTRKGNLDSMKHGIYSRLFPKRIWSTLPKYITKVYKKDKINKCNKKKSQSKVNFKKYKYITKSGQSATVSSKFSSGFLGTWGKMRNSMLLSY